MGKFRLRFRKNKKKVMKAGKPLIERISENDVTGMAAQLAYFFLLSLFPLLIFMVTLLPYTPITQQDIFNLIKEFAPPDTLQLIQDNINQVMSSRSGGLLSVGLLGTIWSASKGMVALIKALNRAYNVSEKRSFVVTRGLALLMMFGMIFVLLVALLLPVFGKQIGLLLFSTLGLSDVFLQIWSVVRWGLSPLILFVVFLVIYYIAPNIKIKCMTAVPGAIFASVGWIVVSYIFSFYVSHFGNYTSTYGSIGAVIVLMLWFYISAIIILIGGEINSLWSDRKKSCDV